MGKSQKAFSYQAAFHNTSATHPQLILQLPMPSQVAVQRGESPSTFVAAGSESALQKRIIVASMASAKKVGQAARNGQGKQ
jgi:hypothetical protein